MFLGTMWLRKKEGNNKMKKIMGLSTLALAGVLAVTGCSKGMTEEEALKYAQEQGYVKVTAPAALPAPVDATKMATVKQNGQNVEVSCDTDDNTIRFNAGCSSINYSNLKDYLGREDVFYVDVRDSNNNETSTSYNTGSYNGLHLKGFANVPFFSYVYPQGGGVGTNQLFYQTAEDEFTPRYTTSVEILETLFPKDKTLFIMCESGGRVVTLMRLLAQYGWDMDKVYNVGGMGHFTEARGYKDYRVAAVDDTEYTVLSNTEAVTDTVEGVSLSVKVNVLYQADFDVIGGVYIHNDSVYSSSSYKEVIDAELDALKSQIVGKSVEEVRAMVEDNTLADDVDVIAGATTTTKVILKAVIAALADVVVGEE